MRLPGDTSTTPRLRRRVRVRGAVQGVGFRPYVYTLARSLDLAGAVWNDGEGVLVEVEGAPSAIERFCQRIGVDPPPLSSVVAIEWIDIRPSAGRPSRSPPPTRRRGGPMSRRT